MTMTISDLRFPELDVPLVGRVSEFGGKDDTGMKPDEGLALVPGLGRDLDPNDMYCAMRWNYALTPKSMLLKCIVEVTHVKDNEVFTVNLKLVDFGPASHTGRLIDISPGAMKALHAKTDDLVSCTLKLL